MTTPTGKLAWAQSGVYDAVDDRAVISAMTQGRTGLSRPVEVRAGTGLQLIVTAGWLGVASCNDLTSAVVGSRLDHVVTANPGPATGSRWDHLWCDTDPDDGTWSLTVIAGGAEPGRPGVRLAHILVPANATLASQMDIYPQDATLERRLLGHNADSPPLSGGHDPTLGWAWSDWPSAWETSLSTAEVILEPGQWYRVRHELSSPRATYVNPGAPGNPPNTPEGGANNEAHVGVGMRNVGEPASATPLGKRSSWFFYGLWHPQQASVEWVFRHPKNGQRQAKIFDGRMWMNYIGYFYHLTAYPNQPEQRMITVEDVGS